MILTALRFFVALPFFGCIAADLGLEALRADAFTLFLADVERDAAGVAGRLLPAPALLGDPAPAEEAALRDEAAVR
jgi:hypothetical protein